MGDIYLLTFDRALMPQQPNVVVLEKVLPESATPGSPLEVRLGSDAVTSARASGKILIPINRKGAEQLHAALQRLLHPESCAKRVEESQADEGTDC